MVQDMLLRSFISEGIDFLGIVVTYSCFQTLGHTLEAVIALKMLDSKEVPVAGE